MPSGRAVQFFILIVCLFSWEEPQSLWDGWRQGPAFTWETLLLCEVVLGKGGKGSRKFHAYKHCQKRWRLWWRIIEKRLVALTKGKCQNSHKFIEEKPGKDNQSEPSWNHPQLWRSGRLCAYARLHPLRIRERHGTGLKGVKWRKTKNVLPIICFYKVQVISHCLCWPTVHPEKNSGWKTGWGTLYFRKTGPWDS